MERLRTLSLAILLAVGGLSCAGEGPTARDGAGRATTSSPDPGREGALGIIESGTCRTTGVLVYAFGGRSE